MDDIRLESRYCRPDATGKDWHIHKRAVTWSDPKPLHGCSAQIVRVGEIIPPRCNGTVMTTCAKTTNKRQQLSLRTTSCQGTNNESKAGHVSAGIWTAGQSYKPGVERAIELTA